MYHGLGGIGRGWPHAPEARAARRCYRCLTAATVAGAVFADFAAALEPGDYDLVRQGLLKIADRIDPGGALGVGDTQ